MSEIICKLKVNHGEDRAQLCSILAFAGYKVSIEEIKRERYIITPDYFVVVEAKEPAHE